jgi:hypothetical protein
VQPPAAEEPRKLRVARNLARAFVVFGRRVSDDFSGPRLFCAWRRLQISPECRGSVMAGMVRLPACRGERAELGRPGAACDHWSAPSVMAALAGVVIAKPLPATSTTPMTINKGAFMCDLRYLRSSPGGVLLRSPRGALMFFSRSKSANIRCGRSPSGLKCACSSCPSSLGRSWCFAVSS